MSAITHTLLSFLELVSQDGCNINFKEDIKLSFFTCNFRQASDDDTVDFYTFYIKPIQISSGLLP